MHTDEQKMSKNVVILNFPRKRGRPKSAHRGIDIGTPELVMKRQSGETAETLDLCLERGLIDAQQHWCGIHLRWLYTLRYGAPGIRAIDPTHAKGIEIKMDDPQWRAEREKEYHEAINKITLSGHIILLVNVCVYNERPKFLNTIRGDALESAETIARLRAGLDVLAKLWRR